MGLRRRKDRLERRLEAERPQPPDELVSDLARRITAEVVPSRPLWRVTVAVAFTAMLVAAFALTGGMVYAASAVQGGTTALTALVTGPPSHANGPANSNKPQGDNNASSAQAGGQSEEKVTICHVPPGNPDNPQTITIGASAVPSHLEEHEGDSVGPCEEPGPPDDQYADKVLICHIPPGNEENAHIISVSVNAVPAHVAHGDPVPPDLGPCE